MLWRMLAKVQTGGVGLQRQLSGPYHEFDGGVGSETSSNAGAGVTRATSSARKGADGGSDSDGSATTAPESDDETYGFNNDDLGDEFGSDSNR